MPLLLAAPLMPYACRYYDADEDARVFRWRFAEARGYAHAASRAAARDVYVMRAADELSSSSSIMMFYLISPLTISHTAMLCYVTDSPFSDDADAASAYDFAAAPR